MRKYSIDANRNTDDLKLKVLANWEYNNLLLTCYDTALLWLVDLYRSAPQGHYPAIDEVNLITIVKALHNRSAFIEVNLKGYDRLYFIYELVYRNYLPATKKDVIEAIKTLDRIVKWWSTECSWESLTELVLFRFPERAEEVQKMQRNDINRGILLSLLNLSNSIENTWKLMEVNLE